MFAASPDRGTLQVTALEGNRFFRRANTFWERYLDHDQAADLSRATKLFSHVRRIFPETHEKAVASANSLEKGVRRSLAKEHLQKFGQTGNVDELHRAIVHHEKILEAHYHSRILGDLGLCHQERFEKLGNNLDLQLAIDYYQQVITLQSATKEARGRAFGNLAMCLRMRFSKAGDRKDMETAIAFNEKCIKTLPNRDPNRWEFLNNLAACFIMRMSYTVDPEDIDRAAHWSHEALDSLTDKTDPRRRWAYLTLGETLRIRFDIRGNVNDINLAIKFVNIALKAVPENHPDRRNVLSTLGLCHQTRFDRLDEEIDLTESIALHEQRVALTPPGDPYRSLCISCLVDALMSRTSHNLNKEPTDLLVVHYVR